MEPALVRALGLRPLPREGGWFVETWRSREVVPTPFGERSRSTAILYLVAEGFPSTLHRLRFDEVWHWHLGDPVEWIAVPGDGAARRVVLGPDLEAGMQVQAVVPAGAWQGARLLPGGRWALLGTTMAPGFDPADFEGATAAEAAALAAAHPAHADLLRALAPPVRSTGTAGGLRPPLRGHPPAKRDPRLAGNVPCRGRRTRPAP